MIAEATLEENLEESEEHSLYNNTRVPLCEKLVVTPYRPHDHSAGAMNLSSLEKSQENTPGPISKLPQKREDRKPA
jgi:hypothetical protein